MRLLLAPALVLSLASPAAAANCAYSGSLKDNPGSLTACETQIEQAAAELKSADAAVKAKAAQRIKDAAAVLDKAYDSLGKESDATNDGPTLANISMARGLIETIREDQGPAIQSAGTIAAGPQPAAPGASGAPPTKPAGQGPPSGGAAPPGGAGAQTAGGANAGTGEAGAAGMPGGGAGDAGGSAGGAGGGAGREPVVKGQTVGAPDAPANSAPGRRAAALGEALKAGFSGTDGGFSGRGPGSGMRASGFGGGSGAGGAAGARAAGGSGPRQPSVGGAGPMSLAAAAASGFADTFRSLGLKVGPNGSVQRLDGSPATAAEVARLQQRLGSDPQALLKRPDLFNVLPREKYGRLKGDYNGKPEQREDAFKHVGVTQDERDFVHTKSCDKDLETDCNKHTRAKRYRQGDFVSPEDLKAIDEALHPEDGQDASAASPAAAYDGASAREDAGTPSADSPRAPSGVAGRLGALRSRLSGTRPAATTAASRPGSSPESGGQRAAGRAGRPGAPLALYGFTLAGLAALVGAWFAATRKRRGFMER